jgi:ABC-2 type transport system permease protein
MPKTKIVSQNKVPGSIKQVGVTVKYTLLDYIRSRRFYVLLAISLLVSAILTFLVAYYQPEALLQDDLTFYNTWWGGISIYVVVLSGIFFGGDAISGEFQNKTGYFSVPNPIRRSSIYVGKWLSALIASTIILAVFAAITMVNGIHYFPSGVPYQFGESLLFAWIYLVAVLGTSFFFSSLFKSSSMSILVTAILFLFAFNIVSTFVANFAQIEPWFIITYGAGIIGNILIDPYPQQVSHRSLGPLGKYQVTEYNATVPEGLIIMAVYFVVTAILGLLLFERKDFT